MGRIAGQMISTIFALLKQDAETLSRLPVGAPPPEPIRYDPALHQQHRTGRYRPSAPDKRVQMLEFVPR